MCSFVCMCLCLCMDIYSCVEQLQNNKIRKLVTHLCLLDITRMLHHELSTIWSYKQDYIMTTPVPTWAGEFPRPPLLDEKLQAINGS